MGTPLLEMDGTVAEITERMSAFEGQRLHVTVDLSETEHKEYAPTASGYPPIVEKILALAALIPKEEAEKMPHDLAEQHDHYIYGWPKK